MFSVEVSAVDGRVGGAASFFEFEEFVGGIGAEFGEKRLFELLKKEGEGTADDEGCWGFVIDDVD